MDTAVRNNALFRGHDRREDKNLLLHLTVVDPCSSSNLDTEAKKPISAIAAAARRKLNKYWDALPATYTFIPWTASKCDTLGSNTQALIKVMAVRTC